MTDNDVQILFALDEAATLPLDTGFRKPTSRLTLSNRSALRSALLDFHCMLKVKTCMDQHMEGLNDLDILDMIRKYHGFFKGFTP